MTTPTKTDVDILKIQTLPFSIDSKSFSTWLVSLDTSDKVETLEILLPILSTLKIITIKPDLRFFFLEKISTLTFQSSEKLQENYIKNYFPFSKNDTLKINLSIHCAIEIAENYSLIAKNQCFKTEDIFSPQQKALTLFNGIRAMSSVLLYKAMLYEKPGKGFWSLCYLFYLFAKQNNVIELCPENINTCFIKVCKQLLIFELSNIQQFTTEEIHVTFNLLGNFSDHTNLLSEVPENKIHSVPFFNLRTDQPPSISKTIAPEQSPHLFYISSIDLIKRLIGLIELKNNMSYSNKIMVLRLIKTLTMKQQRRHERESIVSEVFAEIGFDEFKQFNLQKPSFSKAKQTTPNKHQNFSTNSPLKTGNTAKNKQKPSLSLAWQPGDNSIEHVENTNIWAAEEYVLEPEQESGPKPQSMETQFPFEIEHLSAEEQLKKESRAELFGYKNELDAGLSLTWRPEENKVEYIGSTDIWAAGEEIELEQSEPNSNAKLIDQSNLGFCIGLKDKSAATKVGEIIHLIISSASILTIVRRIISAHSDGLVVGVEVLGYDAELLHIMDSEDEKSKATCILVNIDGAESIVIRSDDFENEKDLLVKRGEKTVRYQIEKVLNSSSSATKHLKVSLSQE